jgi:hypothetical protein
LSYTSGLGTARPRPEPRLFSSGGRPPVPPAVTRKYRTATGDQHCADHGLQLKR